MALAAGLLGATGGCRRAPSAPAGQTLPAGLGDGGGPPGSAPSAPRGTAIAVLYGSDLQGAYDPCACAVQPMGGLARRATQVERARREADAVLVLDAGDTFSPQEIPKVVPADVDRQARLVARGFGHIGTTALAPGERDLALGLPRLRRLAAEAGVPLLSANLRDRAGAPLFAADLLQTTAGVKIGIFGITAPPTPAAEAAFRAAGIDAGDPPAAARDEVAALKARGAAIVIALVHVGTPAETRRLLAAVPGIDWAVAGHSGLRLESAEKVGGARMLGVMPEGKELGRLDLHVVGGGTVFSDRAERAEVQAILADHRRQLVAYDRPLGDTDPASMSEYYQMRRRELEKAVAREATLLERLPRAIAGSWFEIRLIPLDPETPDQPGVALLVAEYKRDSAGRPPGGKPPGHGGGPGRRHDQAQP